MPTAFAAKFPGRCVILASDRYQSTLDGMVHGFLLDRGSFTTIDPPGSTDTELTGINDHDQTVGSYFDGETGHGLLFDHGTFTTIDAPGATTGTHPAGINNSGQIVGQFEDSSGVHGFLFDGENFTTIDAPDALFTLLRGINNRGQMVGRYRTTDNRDVLFLLENDVFTPITGPDGMFLGDVYGVNDSGQIIGEGIGVSSFLLDNGTFVKIEVLARNAYTLGSGINNRGQIVGQYQTATGPQHGFIY